MVCSCSIVSYQSSGSKPPWHLTTSRAATEREWIPRQPTHRSESPFFSSLPISNSEPKKQSTFTNMFFCCSDINSISNAYIHFKHSPKHLCHICKVSYINGYFLTVITIIEDAYALNSNSTRTDLTPCYPAIQVEAVNTGDSDFQKTNINLISLEWILPSFCSNM